jgi:hypothetical protein
MSLVIENKLLFVHTKKTGGTFIKHTFMRSGYKITNPWREEESQIFEHMPVRELHQTFPQLKEIPSFCFVRDPIQWYRSLYCWLAVMKNPTGWKADINQESFEKYMENVFEHFPRYASHQILVPAGYGFNVLDNQIFGTRVVTDIGKYETLLQDLYAIADRHGLPLDPSLLLNHKRSKEAGNISDIYVPISIAQRVIEEEKNVYKLFYNIR